MDLSILQPSLRNGLAANAPARRAGDLVLALNLGYPNFNQY